jgi:hypothetical protein
MKQKRQESGKKGQQNPRNERLEWHKSENRDDHPSVVVCRNTYVLT